MCTNKINYTEVVLVPNHPIQENLLRHWSRGRAVSLAPPIRIFSVWWQVLYRDWLLHEAGAHQPLLLTELQEQMIWAGIVQEAVGGSDWLLNPRAASLLAKQAYRLEQHWELAREAHSDETEWRSYSDWRERFEARCEVLGMLSPHRALAQVTQALRNGFMPNLPERCCLRGFYTITDAEQALLDVLSERGVEIQIQAAERTQQSLQYQSYPDLDSECHQAVIWALEEEQAGRSVGLVVMELEALAGKLCSAFVEAMPQLELPQRQNIELALLPLAKQPLVEQGLQLLDICQQTTPMTFYQLTYLITSPCLLEAEKEANQRAEFDRWLRANGHYRVGFGRLLRLLAHWNRTEDDHNCGSLLRILKRVHVLRQQTAQAPLRRLLEILQALGWPGRVSPAEQAVLNRFNQLCEQVQDAANLQSLDLYETFQWLRHLTQASRPKRFTIPGTRIDILPFESAYGARYECVRILNVHQTSWPLNSYHNPLLPVRWQRTIPHSDPQQQLGICRQISNDLTALADSVVCSYALRHADLEQTDSPLISEITGAAVINSTAQLNVANTHREPAVNWRALGPGVVLESVAAELRIPVGVLQDQAVCPLLAYFRHRLHMRELPVPQPGMPAQLKGSVMHRVMELLWDQMGTQQVLIEQLESGAAQEFVRETIDAVLSTASSTLPSSLLQIETQRMQQLVSAWLLLESQRETFSVCATEQTVEYLFGPCRVVGRIDRIDRMADGSYWLIDYKSGSTRANLWLTERLLETQMPLYQLAWKGPREASAQGAVLATLKTGRMGFTGIVKDAQFLAQVEHVGNVKSELNPPVRGQLKEFSSWAALSEYWQNQIEQLLREFAAGHASRTVYDPQSFRLYSGRLLLRQYDSLPPEAESGNA